MHALRDLPYCFGSMKSNNISVKYMKISIITPRFTIAGVPLAQLRLARAIAERGHEVELVIGWINQGYTAPVIDGVKVRVFNMRRVIGMVIPLTRYLMEYNPNVVFSAEDHLNVVVLLAALISRSRAKISCSSRVTPFDTYSTIPFSKGWILKIFMRAVMHRANALTCVSKEMVVQYKRVFKSPPHVFAYNIIVNDLARRMMAEPVDEEWFSDKSRPILVAAGRLAPWKGFGDLILAMGQVAKSRRVRLIILGDGPSRSALQTLIEKLDLGAEIKLLGYVDNPLKYFSRADVFVLSSHVEGLPNVLVEAMMCGCTPVSTDCATGPREVLQDGKYGYLVPVRDPIALAAGITQALDRPISKSLLAEAVRPFEEDTVLARHFELLSLTEKL